MTLYDHAYQDGDERAPVEHLPWLIGQARDDVRRSEHHRQRALDQHGVGSPQHSRCGTMVVSTRRRLARLQERLRLSRHA